VPSPVVCVKGGAFMRNVDVSIHGVLGLNVLYAAVVPSCTARARTVLVSMKRELIVEKTVAVEMKLDTGEKTMDTGEEMRATCKELNVAVDVITLLGPKMPVALVLPRICRVVFDKKTRGRLPKMSMLPVV